MFADFIEYYGSVIVELDAKAFMKVYASKGMDQNGAMHDISST